jgi:hyaluronoglucosaminidase
LLAVVAGVAVARVFSSTAASAGETSADDTEGDGEPFPFRGVIEGFYGPPWAKQDRLDLLGWMVDHDMNTYIHAPKNDPYQRSEWRSPYPQQTIEQFAREIELVHPQGMAWVPSISPGLPALGATEDHDTDICFSCDDDFGVLTDKLDQFWELGVRTFMVSFDDVVKASSHPEDAATYGEGDYAYGLANADLLNRVYAHYHAKDPSFRLFTVPADYFGATTTPYLEGLSSQLRGEITVLWTGRAVVNKTITCTEADGYAQAVGRKPLVWDNFPINDYAPNKLMLGPYAGRSPKLDECTSGVVANAALQARANKLPLATVADYLADPAGYDLESSWSASLAELAGDREATLRRFVENVRSTAVDRTEAVSFDTLATRFLEALETPDWPQAHAELAEELAAERQAPEKLRAHFPDQRLVAELDCALADIQRGGVQMSTERDCTGSWLERLAFNAANGQETTQYLTQTRPDVDGRISDGVLEGVARPPVGPQKAAANAEVLRGMRGREDGNPANVHGDRFFNSLGRTYAEANRMDDYFDAAAERAARYAGIAEAASASVTVTVDGEPVELAEDGSFAARVGRRAMVVATDGAGNRTRRVFTAEPGDGQASSEDGQAPSEDGQAPSEDGQAPSEGQSSETGSRPSEGAPGTRSGDSTDSADSPTRQRRDSGEAAPAARSEGLSVSDTRPLPETGGGTLVTLMGAALVAVGTAIWGNR